ncbi:type I restriction endonuclease subunit S, partial [Gilliamella apicola]
MIDANTIKSLLKGVDVEWKKITDIFNIKNGYTPSKTNTEFWTDGDIPWFRMEDIRENGRILNNSL